MDSSGRILSIPAGREGEGHDHVGGGCQRLSKSWLRHSAGLDSLPLGLPGALFQGPTWEWSGSAGSRARMLALGSRKGGQEDCWHHCPHQTQGPEGQSESLIQAWLLPWLHWRRGGRSEGEPRRLLWGQRDRNSSEGKGGSRETPWTVEKKGGQER